MIRAVNPATVIRSGTLQWTTKFAATVPFERRVIPRVVVDLAASHMFGLITRGLDTEWVHQWLSTSGRQ